MVYPKISWLEKSYFTPFWNFLALALMFILPKISQLENSSQIIPTEILSNIPAKPFALYLHECSLRIYDSKMTFEIFTHTCASIQKYHMNPFIMIFECAFPCKSFCSTLFTWFHTICYYRNIRFAIFISLWLMIKCNN